MAACPPQKDFHYIRDIHLPYIGVYDFLCASIHLDQLLEAHFADDKCF
jgi:hypothetical protein